MDRVSPEISYLFRDWNKSAQSDQDFATDLACSLSLCRQERALINCCVSCLIGASGSAVNGAPRQLANPCAGVVGNLVTRDDSGTEISGSEHWVRERGIGKEAKKNARRSPAGA